jgi:hypothetical protein
MTLKRTWIIIIAVMIAMMRIIINNNNHKATINRKMMRGVDQFPGGVLAHQGAKVQGVMHLKNSAAV